MSNPPSKKPGPKALTPTQKLILTGWTLFVVLLTFLIFGRAGARILMVALVLMPLIFGVLLGMRMLDKFEEIAKAFGWAPKATESAANPNVSQHFDEFISFLKSHQPRGQFTAAELRRFCDARELKEETLIALGRKKGWFTQMGGAFVISSEGDAWLQKFS